MDSAESPRRHCSQKVPWESRHLQLSWSLRPSNKCHRRKKKRQLARPPAPVKQSPTTLLLPQFRLLFFFFFFDFPPSAAYLHNSLSSSLVEAARGYLEANRPNLRHPGKKKRCLCLHRLRASSHANILFDDFFLDVSRKRHTEPMMLSGRWNSRTAAHSLMWISTGKVFSHSERDSGDRVESTPHMCGSMMITSRHTLRPSVDLCLGWDEVIASGKGMLEDSRPTWRVGSGRDPQQKGTLNMSNSTMLRPLNKFRCPARLKGRKQRQVSPLGRIQAQGMRMCRCRLGSLALESDNCL